MRIVTSVKTFPNDFFLFESWHNSWPAACVSLSWLSLCCFKFLLRTDLKWTPLHEASLSLQRVWGGEDGHQGRHPCTPEGAGAGALVFRGWRLPIGALHQIPTAVTSSSNDDIFFSFPTGWWTSQTLGSWTFPLISKLRQTVKWKVYKFLFPFAKAFFSLSFFLTLCNVWFWCPLEEVSPVRVVKMLAVHAIWIRWCGAAGPAASRH